MKEKTQIEDCQFKCGGKIDWMVCDEEGANHKLIICGQMESDDTPCEEDGYLFVLCPECFGTRKKNTTNEQKLAQLKEKFNL